MRCGRSDPCRVRVGALSTKHANESPWILFLASTKCKLNERIHQQEEYLEAQWQRVCVFSPCRVRLRLREHVSQCSL